MKLETFTVKVFKINCYHFISTHLFGISNKKMTLKSMT